MSILKCNNLEKNFNSKKVVQDISIEVSSGEVIGLLGPNGAGKSTLFNIAIGAEDADSGEVFVNGKNITQIPIHLRSKLGLGYMPQLRSLFDDLSVFNNLMGLIQLFEKNNKKAKEKCELLLEQFNLTHLRSITAGNVSGGEAKRISLARIMINNPKIVLLDESFSNIDPIHVQEMQKYIMKIQSQGVACILSEHGLDNLFKITDRNYLINDGHIVAEGTKRELLKNSEAVKSYFGLDFSK